MNPKIIIAEDERKIAQLLQDYLQQSEYSVQIEPDGNQLVNLIREEEVDLLLLDWMLPGKNGIDLCREIRTFSSLPIVMITARSEEQDRLKGLELGADDYICKPFSPREVVARVKAVLRRTAGKEGASLLRSGVLSLNSETHQVFVKDEELPLTPNEFGILKVMIARPQRVFRREELLNLVLGYHFEGYDRTIDTHIKNLRKKLTRHGVDNCIVSVYGVGYRFHEPNSSN